MLKNQINTCYKIREIHLTESEKYMLQNLRNTCYRLRYALQLQMKLRIADGLFVQQQHKSRLCIPRMTRRLACGKEFVRRSFVIIFGHAHLQEQRAKMCYDSRKPKIWWELRERVRPIGSTKLLGATSPLHWKIQKKWRNMLHIHVQCFL